MVDGGMSGRDAADRGAFALARIRLTSDWPLGRRVFSLSAIGIAAVAAGLLAIASAAMVADIPAVPPAITLAPLWLWLAAILLVAEPWLFGCFQLALTLAVWFSVGAWLERQSWFIAANRWLDPWALQGEDIGLVALSLAWILIRVFAMRKAIWTSRLNPPYMAVDRVVLRCVVAGLAMLGVYAALPGIAQELSSHQTIFEFARVAHLHAQGWGSWLLLAVTAAWRLVADSLERRQTFATRLVRVALIACPLVGSLWEPQFAVASATRWCAMIFVAVGTLVLFAFQQWARIRTAGLDSSEPPTTVDGRARPSPDLEIAGNLLFIIGAAPALAGAIYAVSAALAQTPVAGPIADSFFGRIGSALSYGVPLALGALVLIGQAMRRRSAEFALGGGVFLVNTTAVAYLLSLADPTLTLDKLRWTALLQLIAIVAAGYSLVWMGYVLWITRKRLARLPSIDASLAIQLGIPVFCMCWLIGSAWLRLVDQQIASPELVAVGDIRGWAAMLLTAIALLVAGRAYGRPSAVVQGVMPGILGGGVAFGCWCGFMTLLACTACRWDTGDYLAFHVLLVGHALAGWLLLVGSWLTQRQGEDKRLDEASSREGTGGTGSPAGDFFDLRLLAVRKRCLELESIRPCDRRRAVVVGSGRWN